MLIKMMTKSFIKLLITLVSLNLNYAIAQAQDTIVHPSLTGFGLFMGETAPLREIPPMTAYEQRIMAEKAIRKINNPKLRTRSYPFTETALPNGPDAAWQKGMGTNGIPKAPLVNFTGQSSPYYPSDANGTAGPLYYMQTVNCTYAIYNKSGDLLVGPTAINTLFSGVPGADYNDGDPLVLYDEQADRWLVVEFSISGSNDYMLVAVSTTSDPTGTWYKYSFDVVDMPDYEKFGIWQDGYYMGVNNPSGKDIYVFQRSVMLAGGTSPLMVGFDNPNRPTSIDGFMCVPPVDNDGTFAPAGSPGTFIAFNDDAIAGGSDQLWIYELTVNWATPTASTFSRVQQINVIPFDSDFGNTWSNIEQPGTSQKLDAIPMVVMHAPQYRNFGTYQTIVCCHTVDVDASNHAGIRWYELRRDTQTSGSWTIRQQGTYAPDGHSRWMGSIMLNGSGRIGLGYSVSSSTIYPGIRYTGQSSNGYSSASGIMDIPEETILTATTSQSSYNRWGDYSLMSVDPADDQTFWYTTQYGGSRQTKIASFKLGNEPVVSTLAAQNVTETSATLHGTVNPNGLASTYHFEYGTTTSYGNTTPIMSAGAGSTTVPVSAPISDLTVGWTYHFRLTANNSDGITNGNDITFTPGMASVTTSPVSTITTTTATAGGNVISDGGAVVTVRGVCWSTNTDPIATGNHTVDGSGNGTFISLITDLSANTTYYVRAYATNANGTVYGENVQFTTNCGVYIPPFSQGFAVTTIPLCWSQIDHENNGQIWTFGTITGYSGNVPNLSGNYAYLNSDGYGIGNSQNADLITPALDLSAFANITLQFQHYFREYSTSSGTVSYSIDNGNIWIPIQTYTTTTSNPATFSQVIVSVAGQSNVKFKWNYTGTWGYYWGIDNVQITGVALPDKTLNLAVLLEGLYNGTSLNKAQSELGDQFPGNTADQITIELHDASNYNNIHFTSMVDLSTVGTTSITVPPTLNGSYYITIRHRNSITTTTAVSISFAASTINYDFTISAGAAFGSNQCSLGGGKYGIYAGDIDQDSTIGVLDMALADNQSAQFATGYLVEDINGDGSVGVLDLGIIDNNSANFVSSILPP